MQRFYRWLVFRWFFFPVSKQNIMFKYYETETEWIERNSKSLFISSRCKQMMQCYTLNCCCEFIIMLGYFWTKFWVLHCQNRNGFSCFAFILSCVLPKQHQNNISLSVIDRQIFLFWRQFCVYIRICRDLCCDYIFRMQKHHGFILILAFAYINVAMTLVSDIHNSVHENAQLI